MPCVRWHLAAHLVALALVGTPPATAQADSSSPLHFVGHTIDTGLTGGYQAVVADLNRDGRPDVIAVTLGLEELPWYENRVGRNTSWFPVCGG